MEVKTIILFGVKRTLKYSIHSSKKKIFFTIVKRFGIWNTNDIKKNINFPCLTFKLQFLPTFFKYWGKLFCSQALINNRMPSLCQFQCVTSCPTPTPCIKTLDWHWGCGLGIMFVRWGWARTGVGRNCGLS